MRSCAALRRGRRVTPAAPSLLASKNASARQEDRREVGEPAQRGQDLGNPDDRARGNKYNVARPQPEVRVRSAVVQVLPHVNLGGHRRGGAGLTDEIYGIQLRVVGGP